MHGLRTIALMMVLCAGLPAVTLHASAQSVDPDAIEIPRSQSGESYRQAVRGGRSKIDLVYLKPEADETLPRDTAKPEPASDGPVADWDRIVLIAVTVAILIAIGIFASQFAPKTTISMSSPEDRTRGDRRRRPDSARPADTPAGLAAGSDFLNQLRAMPDRKQALILLLKRALERALEIHGMTLGRSQTAREILRKLPRNWAHYSALARIVGFEERVQFGGHDLPEPVFQESLSLAEPLFAQEASA